RGENQHHGQARLDESIVQGGRQTHRYRTPVNGWLKGCVDVLRHLARPINVFTRTSHGPKETSSGGDQNGAEKKLFHEPIRLAGGDDCRLRSRRARDRTESAGAPRRTGRWRFYRVSTKADYGSRRSRTRQKAVRGELQLLSWRRCARG